MLRTLVLALALAACGGKTGISRTDYAGSLTLTLVNQTPRSIDSIYIFPQGSPSRGTSWTSLAPGATTTVKIREGNFDLVAVSAKRRIDAKYTETPEAMTTLELRSDFGNQKLVFHDADQTPAGVGAPGAHAVTFMLGQPDPTPTPGPSPDPAAGSSPEPAAGSSPVPAAGGNPAPTP